jgi:hypothetical protein
MRTWPNPGSGVSTIVTLVDTDPGLSYTAALWCLGIVTGDMLVGRELYSCPDVFSQRISSIYQQGCTTGQHQEVIDTYNALLRKVVCLTVLQPHHLCDSHQANTGS